MAADIHTFTFGHGVTAGLVTAYKNQYEANGDISFKYSYDWEGARIDGEFKGRYPSAADGIDGRVVGTWVETSDVKIDGKVRWQGTAELRSVKRDGRRSFFGTWTMPKFNKERWVIDVRE